MVFAQKPAWRIVSVDRYFAIENLTRYFNKSRSRSWCWGTFLFSDVFTASTVHWAMTGHLTTPSLWPGFSSGGSWRIAGCISAYTASLLWTEQSVRHWYVSMLSVLQGWKAQENVFGVLFVTIEISRTRPLIWVPTFNQRTNNSVVPSSPH